MANKIEIARKMMQSIQYDCGMVDRLNPEAYPEDAVIEIADAADKFFTVHPDLLNDDDIDDLCNGEIGANIRKYSVYEGYIEFKEVLDKHYPSRGFMMFGD